MKSSLLTIATSILISLVILSVQSIGQEATDLSALFEKKCNVCHKSERAKALQKTKEEWTKTVTRMKSKRPGISDDESRAIIDYLTKTYGK